MCGIIFEYGGKIYLEEKGSWNDRGKKTNNYNLQDAKTYNLGASYQITFLHFDLLWKDSDALQMNLYFTQYVLCTFGILYFLSLVFFIHRNIILDMFVDICKSNNAIMFSLWQERDD